MAEAREDNEAGQPIRMDDATKVVLRSREHVPTEIVLRSRKFYPKEYKNEGFKGVVWRGKDEYNGDVAIKFTIHADYVERSYLEEASRARSLVDSEHFARFQDAGIVDLPWKDGRERKFVIFVEQWIEGLVLPRYIEDHSATPAFLLSYVRGMCSALGALGAKGHRHDDLRPENVMIQLPQEGDVSAEAKVKVIDTGSMKSADAPLRKPKDDHRWFAEHLLLIRNALARRKPLPLHEARFVKEIDPLLDRMFEEDRGASLWAPGRIYRDFESAWTRAQAPFGQPVAELSNPFDYIAAEHIVSDELLVRLFADSCPWFSEVAGPNPVLLTGPRGCGKSMVFRRLSLKALLHKAPEDVEKSEIAGFYVSCSSDLRNRVGWLKSERAANRFRNEIVHYFNLLILREIIQTLSIIARREDRQTLFGFGEVEEAALHAYLMKSLQASDPDQVRLQGMGRMEHALGVIEQQMDQCYRAMRMGVSVSHVTGEPFMADLTRFLAREIAYFASRKVALLIDDFSVHRLPAPVQSILNLVLWDRQGTYVSKVSAEKYGAVGIDELKATSEVARELREMDCGQYYLAARKSATRRFSEDLLAIRLDLAHYAGTPGQLIGKSRYPKGGLGQALREKPSHPGRRNDEYHGLRTIADACSGDVSNLLEVYRRIFELGRVQPTTTEMVPARVQHDAIQSVSRDLFELIRNYTPYGPDMYKVVRWFGTLSRWILQEGGYVRHGSERVVPQTTRIELEPPGPGEAIDELAPSQQNLMDELVRRTIFIEMQPGRSRHRFTTTLRWQLRKIYCPAFGTSIYKTVPIKWRPDVFKRFLIDPKGVCEEEFAKQWAPGRDAPEHPLLDVPTDNSGA